MSSGSDSDPDWIKAFQAPTYHYAGGASPSKITTPGHGNQEKKSSAPPLSIFAGSLSTPDEIQGTPSQSPKLVPSKILKISADEDEKKIGDKEITKATIASKKEIASRLPLIMGKNANQTKLVLEVDSEVDLEGDAGVVGRVKGVGPRDLLLDLKGAIYEGSLMPCATLCILNLSSSLEAKVESVSNSFVQLQEKEMEFIRGVGNCDLSDDEDAVEQTGKGKEDERSSAPGLTADHPDDSTKPSKNRAPAKRKLPSKGGKAQKQSKKPAKKK